ncbi:MAG TPA: hypothetical protein VLV81_03415 [Acidimicrobiia bacterium]|nr:hypothetical protein [Acidimicrobiia bacterium]
MFTSELWLLLLFVPTVIIAGYASHGLGVRPAWIIAGAVILGYLVSRGLAKAGSAHKVHASD